MTEKQIAYYAFYYAVFSYLFCAVAAWEINPGQWHAALRLFGMGFWFFIFSMVYANETKKGAK